VNTFLGVSFVSFYFIFLAVLILPTIFFLLTLQRALSKCSPINRTMSPGLVWLQIIPFFGFIWQFFVVFAIANSMGAEFASRRIPEDPKPGQSIGLAMCITRVCTVIPFLGIFAGIASIVLWIVYWVKIAGYSQQLDTTPGGPYALPPYGGGYYGQGGAPYQGGIPPYSSGPSTGSQSTPSSAGAQKCATCGAPVPAGLAFCTQCGAKVERTV
jgi:hypothetical protein